MENTSTTKPRATIDVRDFEPLSVRGSTADFRIAHALESMAAALCRIDQRLALLGKSPALK